MRGNENMKINVTSTDAQNETGAMRWAISNRLVIWVQVKWRTFAAFPLVLFQWKLNVFGFRGWWFNRTRHMRWCLPFLFHCFWHFWDLIVTHCNNNLNDCQRKLRMKESSLEQNLNVKLKVNVKRIPSWKISMCKFVTGRFFISTRFRLCPHC